MREKTEDSEDMMSVIMQVAIQAAMTVVRVMMEADPTAEPHTRRSSPGKHHRPRQAGTMMSQSAFNWKAPDKYVALLNFKLEVANVLQVKEYDLYDTEKVSTIKNWLHKVGLHFIQTPTNTAKDTFRNSTGLFAVLK